MTARIDARRGWLFFPLGAVLGLATAWSVAAGHSPLAAGALTAALLALLIFRNPEFGAVLIIVLVGIVPRGILFDRGLPVGGGNLKVTDLLLAATLASWLAGRVIRPARFPLPSRSVTVLILAFLTLACVGVLIAHEMGAPFKLSLLELRPLLSFLLVFPLVSGGRSWRQFDRGLSIVLAAAAVSACVAIVEYVRGSGGAATFAGGALRVQATVYLLPLVALVWAPILIAYVRTRRAQVAVLGLAVLSVAGIYFTFARGAWVALLLALPVVVVLLPPRRRRRTLGWLMVLLAVGVSSLFAVNTLSARRVPDPLTAGLRRIESVGNYRGDVSTRYRFAEWNEAIRQIKRHPLTGIGLGNSITFTNPMFSPDYNTYGYTYSTYYIHSSYIWYTLKLGLLGALVFFSLIARVCWLAYRGYRQTDEPRARPILLGSLGSLIAILVLSATGPHLNTDSATPVVAGLIAAVEIARRLSTPSWPMGRA